MYKLKREAIQFRMFPKRFPIPVLARAYCPRGLHFAPGSGQTWRGHSASKAHSSWFFCGGRAAASAYQRNLATSWPVRAAPTPAVVSMRPNSPARALPELGAGSTSRLNTL